MDDYAEEIVAVYDAIADDYAKQADTHGPVGERLRFSVMLPKKAKVLDLGCGSGRDCLFFQKQGFNTVGVDLSEELLKIAKKNAPGISFIKQDIRKIDFPKESFDGIWACASLLHIKHKEIPHVLEKLLGILKTHGIICIHVKKGTGEEERIEPSVPGRKRFFSLFQKDQLARLITKAGFRVIDCFEPPKKSAAKTVWIHCFAERP